MAVAFCFLTLSLVAERQPFERYQSIIDRQMFGQPPPGFDPTRPPSEVAKGSGKDEVALTRDQEQLKSSVHFSVLNMSPDGTVSVGFTDNADAKSPKHYYLKLGEERDGWKVLAADAAERTMTVEKDGVEVTLSLGDDSAKGGGTTARSGGAAAGSPAPARPTLLSMRRGTGLDGTTSLRARRELREQRRQAEAAAAAKAKAEDDARREEERQQRAEEDARRAEEREQQRQQLLQIQEEIRKTREEQRRQAQEAAEREAAENAAE